MAPAATKLQPITTQPSTHTSFTSIHRAVPAIPSLGPSAAAAFDTVEFEYVRGIFLPIRRVLHPEPIHIGSEAKRSCPILPVTPPDCPSTREELIEWCNNVAKTISRVYNPGPRGLIYCCTTENFGVK